ncbi:MAG: hypothetical protein LAN61_10385 [Acidobacteriia bacterium]|nr:hypothetical protein [Terriglobia bacterium]
MLELDCGLEFEAGRDAEFFPALPARAAVCLIAPRDPNAEAFLIRTADLRRRLQRLLGPPDAASKRLNLREFARGVRYRLTGSPFEQTLTYYQHAKELLPKRYRALLRLRPPAVLKVSLRNAYPRCYVTRRISTDAAGAPIAGVYYGPFASRRAADAFAESALDFFKVRRCQIKIRRDPAFPGCIYSEMKMCLAPCFAGCTKEEYDAEVARLVQFLETNGGSLRAAIEQERGQASEALDFERAAALHKRLEKLDGVLRGRPELARRVQDLDAVILQRAAEEQTVGAYPVREGRLGEPFFLRFGEMASEPRSAEELLREHLNLPDGTYKSGNSAQSGFSTAAPNASGPSSGMAEKGDLGEHLALLARWYYANPRVGEIFFREKEWPYRRILRACARLLAPAVEEG